MLNLNEVCLITLVIVIILMLIFERLRSQEALRGSIEAQKLIDRAKRELRDSERGSAK
jgi:hypothetical protein